MTTSTGLFRFAPFGEAIPAYAELAVDPLGHVVACLTIWLPEGTGSDDYEWSSCAYLRPDFARRTLDFVMWIEGEFHLEREWALDPSDDEVDDALHSDTGEADVEALDVMASVAPDLEIAEPGPELRESWAGDREFDESVPATDWSPARNRT